MIPFATSKKGFLKTITIYKYIFSKLYQLDLDKRNKFINWLNQDPKINVFLIEPTCFFLFEPIEKYSKNQYKFLEEVVLIPNYENTPRISMYIGFLLRSNFSLFFERYLNQNIFEVDYLDFTPFKLIKGFEFNVEVFSNGEFYIHLMPVSKIVSNTNLNSDYLKLLKSLFLVDNIKSAELNVINLNTLKSNKFDILNINKYEECENFIKNEKCIATFDYHFLSVCAPKIFLKITENTIKDLTKCIDFLKTVSQKINLPVWVDIETLKEFHKIETPLQNYMTTPNLLIGSGFSCKEQKAAFYNGVYKPVSNKTILPIYLKEQKKTIDLFVDLFYKFNVNGESINILSAIQMEDNASFFKNLKNLQKVHRSNFLIVVFTEYMLEKNALKPLQKMGLQIQTYLGLSDVHKMSNFVVKCIEKLGGVLSIIKNMKEDNTTYFIGIDLGHSTHSKDKKVSNLGMALFNHQGILLKTFVSKDMPRNEALTEASIKQPLEFFLDFLVKSGQPLPNKLIIHRDGKLHKNDIENLISKLSELFDIAEIDIVEVIKSGYPIVAKYDISNKKYVNLATGEAWILEHQKYAILSTNTQINERDGLTNPIIIKHKFGNTDMKTVVMQVYWFTRVYTNNLYNSTRLPATTLKANNIVSTGNVIHISSNLG